MGPGSNNENVERNKEIKKIGLKLYDVFTTPVLVSGDSGDDSGTVKENTVPKGYPQNIIIIPSILEQYKASKQNE